MQLESFTSAALVVDKRIDERKKQDLDKMMKDFIGHVFGVRTSEEKPMRWM